MDNWRHCISYNNYILYSNSIYNGLCRWYIKSSFDSKYNNIIFITEFFAIYYLQCFILYRIEIRKIYVLLSHISVYNKII